MDEKRFFKIYMSTFLAGVLLLMPLSPLMGYLARKITNAYQLDYVVGLYMATAPHMIFFIVMGGWFLFSYWKYRA